MIPLRATPVPHKIPTIVRPQRSSACPRAHAAGPAHTAFAAAIVIALSALVCGCPRSRAIAARASDSPHEPVAEPDAGTPGETLPPAPPGSDAASPASTRID